MDGEELGGWGGVGRMGMIWEDGEELGGWGDLGGWGGVGWMGRSWVDGEELGGWGRVGWMGSSGRMGRSFGECGGREYDAFSHLCIEREWILSVYDMELCSDWLKHAAQVQSEV